MLNLNEHRKQVISKAPYKFQNHTKYIFLIILGSTFSKVTVMVGTEMYLHGMMQVKAFLKLFCLFYGTYVVAWYMCNTLVIL